jgi:hypothetical protein
MLFITPLDAANRCLNAYYNFLKLFNIGIYGANKDYAKSKELFETTEVINIVFKSDFNEDIKYYYDNIKFKCNNYRAADAASDRKVGELYKVRVANKVLIYLAPLICESTAI